MGTLTSCDNLSMTSMSLTSNPTADGERQERDTNLNISSHQKEERRGYGREREEEGGVGWVRRGEVGRAG